MVTIMGKKIISELNLGHYSKERKNSSLVLISKNKKKKSSIEFIYLEKEKL